MWKIHEKYYDLSNFVDRHPGGKKILESCKGIDATAAFESYHVFANMSKVNAIMKKYEVVNNNKTIESSTNTFDDDGFYNELKNEVKNYMRNETTKWTWSWLLMSLATFMIYAHSFSIAFLCLNYSFTYRMAASVISGTTLMQWMLQMYHDATHSAVSSNKYVNHVISIVGSAISFWDMSTWIKHHSVLHHSFTGVYALDPDMKHTHPFFKKNIQSKASMIKDPNIISVMLSIFPGMFLGQILSYAIIQSKKRLWGFTLDFDKTNAEWSIIFVQIGMMIYGRSIVLPLLFLLALNINYSIAILPDHDLLETHLNYKNGSLDWGEMQVRNSGNFAQGNLFFTVLYGGINYQIEHHLFPSLCSCHLSDISNIVQNICKKHDIKYVSNPSIVNAYWSAIKNLGIINNSNVSNKDTKH